MRLIRDSHPEQHAILTLGEAMMFLACVTVPVSFGTMIITAAAIILVFEKYLTSGIKAHDWTDNLLSLAMAIIILSVFVVLEFRVRFAHPPHIADSN